MKQHVSSATLIDYLHHELSPSEDAEVLAHLHSCEACTREMDLEASIADRLRATARATEMEMPAGMHAAIMARIAQHRPTAWEALGAWARPLVFVPVAAAVAAAAFLLVPALSPPPAPARVPVSYYLQQYAAHAQQNPLADRGSAIMASFDDGAR
ncbi:MAG: anti-sigma factor family protein [Vulcanimicrobiaceae bacterium]